jgi:SPOR domain
MKLILSICIALFFVNKSVVAQTTTTTPAKKVKKARKGKAKGDKELDAYFYGGKKNKKGKLPEFDKKGKRTKGGHDVVVDMKSILKSKATANGVGKKTAADDKMYRPIYIGNKMLTGSINAASGFRICIYNGNDRKAALAEKLKFMKSYPSFRSYMSYNSPYYKIKIGDFTDKKMAQKELKSVISNFPSAFISPDMVTVKNIMIYKNQPAAEPQSVSN